MYRMPVPYGKKVLLSINYPFTAPPTVREFSILSLKHRYRIIVGILAIIIAAPIAPQLVLCCPTKVASPAGKVFSSLLEIITVGRIYSFHIPSVANKAPEVIAGFTSGSMIEKKFYKYLLHQLPLPLPVQQAEPEKRMKLS